MATGQESSPRFLEVLRNAIVTYKGTVGSPMSLADISKVARVEPITLISSRLSGVKELYNILHGVLNIYAAYYLQAVHILSAELADVRILKILDKTNPDRDLKTLLAASYTAYESHKDVPVTDGRSLHLSKAKYSLPISFSVASESIWDEDEDTTINSAIKRLESFEKLGLAVGKVIDVQFKVAPTGDARNAIETSIPVVIKLDTMVIPGDVIGNIMTSSTNEITLGSRFKEALSGRIDFIKDFILCSDLIKTQKRTMIKDPTGAYATLLKRINNSRMYSALSGNISLAGVSSILVISDEDEQEIQRAIGGKLTNETTRDIVFENTSAMMIIVVDQPWERVTIYVRDMNGYSQNSFDSFKGEGDKDKSSITELMKAFTLNTAPRF